MKVNNEGDKLIRKLFPALVIAAGILLGTVAQAGDEPRQPPPTRSSDVLSDQVYRAISEIAEMISPVDPDTPADLEGAKRALDELYERRYDRMNDFEKSTVLNFYTNYYLSTDNMPEAIRIFKQMLTIEGLREDTRLRALRALGQLSMAEENFTDAILYYNQWRDLSLEEDDVIFLGLANSHYSLEQYAEAVPFLLSHMQMLIDQGEVVERNKWGLLQALYLAQEDYVNALEVIKNMVVQFDVDSDWRNLAAVYSFLEQDSNRIGALNINFLKGYINGENDYLNLAQSLAGEEAPYTGAKVLEAGIEAGIVVEDEDNLRVLVQLYQLANEFDLAVEPAEKLAEVTPTGEGFDTLGYTHYILHDYESAAEAFRNALEKGDLSDEGDTQLFLSRTLVELDQYDAAAQAARRASDLGDENERRAAQNYLRYIEGQKGRYEALQSRKANALDFYISYD